MARCLYIVFGDPISPNFHGGASSIYFDQLIALAECGLEMHLWHNSGPEQRKRLDEWNSSDAAAWGRVSAACASVDLSSVPLRASNWDRVRTRMQAWSGLGIPRSVSSLRKEFMGRVNRLKPDVIWAQHYDPAVLAATQRQVPVVYAHHDWLFRVKALRNHREIDPRKQRLETSVVREVAACVSGSVTECVELRAFGCKNACYIPVSYEPVDVDWAGFRERPTLVHLGGMGTTANREGLTRFFDVVWPRISKGDVALEILGDISSAPESLAVHLRTVKCHGFIQHLGDVLRPGDLQIIPWEHNTGQRTRVPLAFNYGQVVVSTKAAVSCFPEAVHARNCWLVDRLDEMAGAIELLMNDRRLRESLARQARIDFESSFTRPALIPRYNEVVQKCLKTLYS